MNSLLHNWQRLAPLPGGRWLFSRVLGRTAPYTGSIRPQVLELDAGHARVAMADRRAVRNHLRSIHAIALINLAEVTSGIAMLAGLPADARGIVTGLSIEYVKKARGRLIGECDCTPPRTNAAGEIEVPVLLRDDAGDVVARASARWKIGPVPATDSKDRTQTK
ncbi:MAG: hotdog fold domain-containing protein [Planctomycetota bacterium]|jgi:acyl-coenzyme A thioesterase PaaI-like protein|nr:DUF4442 domain-containing protein [Planctomycetota bacterium]MDP6369692.1 hotdog fold domain-containing protein [Planctomycetota bacterium]MDP6519972.1 hotdog fold domain-containing protein [Planctomycetota bacterium]MDP6837543.1 hotdog fold domain-containing protein [Planctomycetota bacterium]MDP6955128.1 hotdog fold domain-containing protein [Planctomycetota bacterium]